ncbi:molybdopterin-synthase adenylyltransferase MoeB [Gilvimarinus sp. DA14]|uniref:HesA/MoeB/ThiF family protein n=1 Tax=Gilvimarinus sp. DA14 TaxID=2956798 RepID=UPI0020B86062|nr:molybdopterin-synthase adenylyltransferase MoeB [Gilvimarinus sp. DA14]UTF61317.1 molybdopterin-synthase adenylyltransferase MoeB [Gilvimarinus sp. DA14]
MAELTDQQLLRYSRQIMLGEMDIAGQQALLDARVLIVGAGGLGAPVALYLAAAGVGELIIVDDDTVELSNLQRQIIHTSSRIGQTKVDSAKAQLADINPDVQVQALCERLTPARLDELLSGVQAVVDCSDNFSTRFAINRACVQHRVPLVSGAAIRLEGQLAVFDSRRADSPCYRCLYEEQNDENLSCAASGVLAPLVGVIGSAQALETIKLLADFGDTLAGRIQFYDAKNGRWREMRLPKDPDCPVCSDR